MHVSIHYAGEYYDARRVDDFCAVTHFAPDGGDDSAGDGDIG
jgi:hypothetical protein